MKQQSNYAVLIVFLSLAVPSLSLTLEGAWLECTPNTKTVFGDCCGQGQTLTKFCWASQEQLSSLQKEQKTQSVINTFTSSSESQGQNIIEKNSDYYVNKINQQAVYLQCKGKKCLGDATHYHYHQQNHQHLHYFSMDFEPLYEQLGIEFPDINNDYNAYYLIYHTFREKSERGKLNERKQFDIPNATHQIEMYHDHAHWAQHDHVHFYIPYTEEVNGTQSLMKLKSIVLNKAPKKQRVLPKLEKKDLTAKLLKEEIQSFKKVSVNDLQFIQELKSSMKQSEDEFLEIPVRGGDEFVEIPLTHSDLKMQQQDGLHYASISAEHSHYFFIKESSLNTPENEELTNPEIHKQQEKFMMFSQMPLDQVKENPNKVVIHYQNHQVIHVHDHYVLVIPSEEALVKIIDALEDQIDLYPRVQPVEEYPEQDDEGDVYFIESDIEIPEGDFEHYEYQSAEKYIVWDQTYNGDAYGNSIFDESKFESVLEDQSSNIEKYEFTLKFGKTPLDSHSHYHYTYSVTAHEHYIQVQLPLQASISTFAKSKYLNTDELLNASGEQSQSTIYQILKYLAILFIVGFLYFTYKTLAVRKQLKQKKTKGLLKKQKSIEKLLIEVGQS